MTEPLFAVIYNCCGCPDPNLYGVYATAADADVAMHAANLGVASDPDVVEIKPGHTMREAMERHRKILDGPAVTYAKEMGWNEHGTFF